MRRICFRDLCSMQSGGLRAVYLLPVSSFKGLKYSSRMECYYDLECDTSALLCCRFREGEALLDEKLSSRSDGHIFTQRLSLSTVCMGRRERALMDRLLSEDGRFIAFVEDMEQRVLVVGYNHITACRYPLRLESLDSSSGITPDESPSETLVLESMSVCRAGVLIDDIEHLSVR